MPTPTTFASHLTFAGLAAETTQGTAVAPTATLLLNKAPTVKDNQIYLDDVGMRNAMAETYGAVLGTKISDLSFEGDARPDTLGYLVGNIMGDWTVTGAAAPYTYAFALQNAGATGVQTQIAQAHSLTYTDWYGPTASTGARAYPGMMLSGLDFSLDPTKLFTFSAKAQAWASAAAASTPTVSVGTMVPMAGWTGLVGLGGPASGGTLAGNVLSASVSLTRKLEVIPVLGAANPYIIRQGPFGATGKFSVLAADETQLTQYLTNVQPQLQFVFSTGTGATTEVVQFDFQSVYYKSVAPNRGKEAVVFDIDFVGIANTTNAGTSGGYSPCKVTLKSPIAGGSY